MDLIKLELNPSPKAEALKLKGNIAFKATNYTAAIKYYSDALKIRKKGSYYSNRSVCYIKLNKLDEALQDALKGKEIEPDFYRAYTRASKIYLMRGNIKLAIEVVTQGLKRVPEGEALRKELQVLQVISLYENKMQNLIEKKKYKEALSPLEMIQEKCNDDDSLVLKKVKLLCWATETEEARKYVQSEQNRLRKMFPIQFEAQMAIVASYNNDFENAKKYIYTGFRNDPENATLIMIFKKVKKLEKAKQKANDLLEQRRYNEAIQKYDEAILIDPENNKFNSLLLGNKSTCFKRLNKKNEAMIALKEAIRINPTYGKGYLKISDLEEYSGDFDAARDSIMKAKELDPSLDVDTRLQRVTQKVNSEEKSDHYKTLGVNRKATIDQIKKAYKKLAMKWHPDRHSRNEADKKKAAKKFKNIVKAKEVLTDLKKRNSYDLGDFTAYFPKSSARKSYSYSKQSNSPFTKYFQNMYFKSFEKMKTNMNKNFRDNRNERNSNNRFGSTNTTGNFSDFLHSGHFYS